MRRPYRRRPEGNRVLDRPRVALLSWAAVCLGLFVLLGLAVDQGWQVIRDFDDRGDGAQSWTVDTEWVHRPLRWIELTFNTIGMTIMTIPLAQQQNQRILSLGFRGTRLRVRVPEVRRAICLIVGFAYPAIILAAIVATANHFILDAVAGSIVCALAWTGNRVLLNLLPVEDYFLLLVRIHKPERKVVGFEGDDEVDDDDWEQKRVGKGAVIS